MAQANEVPGERVTQTINIRGPITDGLAPAGIDNLERNAYATLPLILVSFPVAPTSQADTEASTSDTRFPGVTDVGMDRMRPRTRFRPGDEFVEVGPA